MQGLIGITRIYLKHAVILLAVGSLLQFASAHTAGQAGAQHAAPLHMQDKLKRPRITGIDHLRLYATNVDKSCLFYARVLGLTTRDDCAIATRPTFAVNWHQRIELEPAPSALPHNWLAEISFATDDVPRMRDYLLAKGVMAGAISSDTVAPPHFEVRDPEGNAIAFVQPWEHLPDGIVSAIQVSRRLIHAGFVVKDMAAENRFYRDVLGFKLYWQGGFKDDGLDWYELQVPDGDNWIEYMLNIPASADHKALGAQNHFSFGVKEIQAAAEQLRKNGIEKVSGPGIGRDGKRGLNVYDPDDTRVEVTEFTPAREPCCHPYTAPHPTP
jgi:catechol 2,3-dioxygenase-like lactoylglutathione lyase family enzyme